MNKEQFQARIDELLLADLQNYQPEGTSGWKLDWSNPENENHPLENVAGGNELNSWSYVNILDSNGKQAGDGWCDFVVEVESGQIYLFWYDLEVDGWDKHPDTDAEGRAHIPPHIWEKLSEKTQLLVGQFGGKYEWRLRSSERMPANLHF